MCEMWFTKITLVEETSIRVSATRNTHTAHIINKCSTNAEYRGQWGDYPFISVSWEFHKNLSPFSLMIYLTNMNLFTNTHLNMDKLTHKCKLTNTWTCSYKHPHTGHVGFRKRPRITLRVRADRGPRRIPEGLESLENVTAATGKHTQLQQNVGAVLQEC